MDYVELVSLGPSVFSVKQWGNLIFVSDAIYKAAITDLQKIIGACEVGLAHMRELKKWKTMCEKKEIEIRRKRIPK